MERQIIPSVLLIITASVYGGFSPRMGVSRRPSESLTLADGGALHQPTFLDPANASFVANVGDTALMDCRIIWLRDKVVSWIKVKDDQVKLITVGINTYANDGRFRIAREHGNENNWQLQIRYSQPRDAGHYQCQVSTHPPMTRSVHLFVRIPKMSILDMRGEPVSEVYYQEGSSVALQCLVEPPPQSQRVTWKKNGEHIDYHYNRDISDKTKRNESVLSNWLHIRRTHKDSSGNYTCEAGPSVTAAVRLHVLDGESSAAMQHPNLEPVGSGGASLSTQLSRGPFLAGTLSISALLSLKEAS